MRSSPSGTVSATSDGARGARRRDSRVPRRPRSTGAMRARDRRRRRARPPRRPPSSASSSASSASWPSRRSGLSATIVSSRRGAPAARRRVSREAPRPARGRAAPRRSTALRRRRACGRPRGRTAGCRASRRTDPPHHGTGEAEPEPLEEETARPAEAQAAELEALDAPGLERLLERGRLARAPREQEPHAVALQPPRCECERRGRCFVEPLDVVERDEHAVVVRERTERVQETDRDRARRCRIAGRRPAEKRDLERLELRRGKALHLVGADGVEHVDQRPEDEPRLGVARPRREDARAVAARRRRRRPPRASSCRSPASRVRTSVPWRPSRRNARSVASSRSRPTTPEPGGASGGVLRAARRRPRWPGPGRCTSMRSRSARRAARAPRAASR